MFPTRLETDRLRLERISHDAVDPVELHELYGAGGDAEEVFEYWDRSPHETLTETVDYVDDAERLWDDAAAAKYVIRPKAGEDGAGCIAGTTGLYPDWETRSATLGILLGTRFWGRGYSGERADAILSLAFERLDLELVVAAAVDGNENSRRAIEKYVDRYEGRYDGRFRNRLSLDDTVVDLHRYTISRDGYFESIDS